MAYGLQFQCLKRKVRFASGGGPVRLGGDMHSELAMVLGVLGIYFLAPLVLAIVAMVQVRNLRRKVEDLERFSARRDLRLAPRPREAAAPPASPPPPMPVEPEEVALLPVQPRVLRAATEVKPEPVPAERVPLENVIGEKILPRLGAIADDLTLVRSLQTDHVLHEAAMTILFTGTQLLGRPSWGSWISYGLGSENQNLPAFVAMCPSGYPIQETQNWQAGFLPGIYEGTYLDTQHTAIEQLVEHIRNDRVAHGPQKLTALFFSPDLVVCFSHVLIKLLLVTKLNNVN